MQGEARQKACPKYNSLRHTTSYQQCQCVLCNTILFLNNYVRHCYQSVAPFLLWPTACSKICDRLLNELGEYRMDFEVTMKTLGVMLVGLLVSVAGCQTGHTVQTGALENGSFMSLWNSYSRCQTATNIDEMTADAATLTLLCQAIFNNSWRRPRPARRWT